MGSWKKKPWAKFVLAPIIPFYRWYCTRKWNKRWAQYLQQNNEINLNVGASITRFVGWFPTDIEINSYYLDVTSEADFQRMLAGKQIRRILAEHVFEHLTTAQIEQALPLLYKYSLPEVRIRIAVPDGYHTDANYIESVKIGGTGEGADDHKQLFTYKTLGALFEKAGFKALPVEYWDENGQFHAGYQDDENGYITRSMLHDSRNKGGKPVYTSLIMDFVK
jgi:predicted SAM-dependent methyltransferase